MFKWTDSAIETLREMILANEPYSAIGSRLGISRNAAVGKAMRLGIADLRPKDASSKSDPRQQTSIRTRTVRPRLHRRVAPQVDYKVAPQVNHRPASALHTCGLPILELRDHGQCKWPVNDPEPGQEHLFCGCPHDNGPKGSYCEHHAPLSIGEEGRHLAMIGKQLKRGFRNG